MAQHEASGKHSANNISSDKSSQETKKIDSTKDEKSSSEETKKIDSVKDENSSAPTEKMKSVKADETKEMPKAAASKSATKSDDDPKDKTVKFHSATESKTVKPVTTGAAEAEAAQAKKKNTVIAAVVAIIVIIIAIIAFMFMNSNHSQTSTDELDMIDVEAQPVDNPINFAEWQAHNPDVYAYMNIPNTNIDLPILFSADEDNYYLVHDIDHNYTIVGAIYSQSMNTQDFTDPVTVLYGHTLLNNTMFSQLHSFEEPGFFEANPYFNVYLPEEILTYEVVSAFEYDNRHIMNTFDFSNPDQVQEFFDTVQAPDSTNMQVRELETPLKAGEDSILVLSTCTTPANDNARFLVVGRLVSKQPAIQVEVAPTEEPAAEGETAE